MGAVGYGLSVMGWGQWVMVYLLWDGRSGWWSISHGMGAVGDGLSAMEWEQLVMVCLSWDGVSWR